MSQVRVSGNASGTGVLTVTSPNTNSNYTLTLPANTGTILTDASTFAGTGPAFSVYQTTGTTAAASTNVLVTFDTEEFDTNNNFASNRFTPTVAGYYQLNAAVRIDGLNATSYMYAWISKNGSTYKYGTILVSAPSTYNYQCIVSTLVNANGSTDYFELGLYQSTGVTKTTGTGIANTYFNGAMVRAA